MILYYIILYYMILYYITLYYIILYYITLYSTLLNSILFYSVLFHKSFFFICQLKVVMVLLGEDLDDDELRDIFNEYDPLLTGRMVSCTM